MRLQDKVIAITGSGSGLGREAALLFAAEGAKIMVSDVVPGRAKAVAKKFWLPAAPRRPPTPTFEKKPTWSGWSRKRLSHMAVST